jgi:hypothetical protein
VIASLVYIDGRLAGIAVEDATDGGWRRHTFAGKPRSVTFDRARKEFTGANEAERQIQGVSCRMDCCTSTRYVSRKRA